MMMIRGWGGRRRSHTAGASSRGRCPVGIVDSEKLCERGGLELRVYTRHIVGHLRTHRRFDQSFCRKASKYKERKPAKK